MKPNSTAHLSLISELIWRKGTGNVDSTNLPRAWPVYAWIPQPNPSVPPTLPRFRWHRPGVLLAQSSKIASNGGEEQLQRGGICNGFPRWEVSNKQLGSLTFWQHVLCPVSCSNTWSYLTMAQCMLTAQRKPVLWVCSWSFFRLRPDFGVEGPQCKARTWL